MSCVGTLYVNEMGLKELTSQKPSNCMDCSYISRVIAQGLRSAQECEEFHRMYCLENPAACPLNTEEQEGVIE